MELYSSPKGIYDENKVKGQVFGLVRRISVNHRPIKELYVYGCFQQALL